MKIRRVQILLSLSMVCMIGSGCTSKQVENNLIDTTEAAQQTEMSIEASLNAQESSNTAKTEKTKEEMTANTTRPETSTAEEEPMNSSEEVIEAASDIEKMPGRDNQISEIRRINGYQLFDGMNIPVEVTFEVVDVKRGEEAYQILLKEKTDLEPAEAGMEYILIQLKVSYVSGDADTVYIRENIASLEAAKMYFALSNGDSNAEQLTDYLRDSIYQLTINKGESAKGSVAFLHRADSQEPLGFIGFGKTIRFDLE